MQVFLSFVGVGPNEADPEALGYSPARYAIGDRVAQETPYVQAALLELLHQKPERVLLVMTESSRRRHWDRPGRLRAALEGLPGTEGGAPWSIEPILIGENVEDPAVQWAAFEAILDAVPHRAELTVDVTHGYRLIPVLLSVATAFLGTAKGVAIKGVYYGVYTRGRPTHPIANATEFFRVNLWAEAVRNLVTAGDARALADVAAAAPEFQSGGLADPHLAESLRRLSLLVRNVDARAVPDAARDAVLNIRRVRDNAGSSVTARILLDTLDQQFAKLAQPDPLTGRYDAAFFQSQLALVGVLNEYQLSMQAFTVLRELLGSIGPAGYPRYRDRGNLLEGRKYADLFVNLCQFDTRWEAPNVDAAKMKVKLDPFVGRLKEAALWPELVLLAQEITRHRNAFDHARMSAKAPPGDDPALGRAAGEATARLSTVINALIARGEIPRHEARTSEP